MAESPSVLAIGWLAIGVGAVSCGARTELGFFTADQSVALSGAGGAPVLSIGGAGGSTPTHRGGGTAVGGGTGGDSGGSSGAGGRVASGGAGALGGAGGSSGGAGGGISGAGGSTGGAGGSASGAGGGGGSGGGVVCEAGLVACGVLCVELQSDPANCGTCRHDCLGGACNAGVCQPVVLASGTPYTYFIAVNATTIYFTTDHGVLQMPLTGGAPTTFASSAGADGIALDSSNVYWTTYAGGTIVRMPLGGGPATVLGSALSSPFGITVDASNIYFTSFWTNTVSRMPLAGGTVVPLSSGSGGVGATGVAISDAQIYWGSNNSSVNQTPFAGGSFAVLVSGEDDPMGVAADATNIYWTILYGGAVMSMPRSGGAPTTLVSGLTAYAGGIAVDATSIYWTTNDYRDVGAVMRLAK